MQYLLTLACLIFAAAVRAPQTGHRARQIFVAADGDDSGAGTMERPFRTVQRGADAAGPGDTVTIRGGHYPEQVKLTRSGNYFGRAITIQSDAGAQVILAGVDTDGQDHLVLKGLTVKNASFLGIAVRGSYRVKVEECRVEGCPGSGIYVDKSNDVTISKCDVADACHSGGEESVSIKRSANVVFEDSIVHDTGHEGIDVKEGSRNVVVRRNRVCHVERQGLYADAWDADTGEIRFENNVIFDCLVGLVACTESGGLLHDVAFVGNVVYDCRGPGMMVAKWGSARMSHRIRNVSYLNNTVVNCGGPGKNGIWGGGMLMENDQAENVIIVNNVFSGNPFAQLRVTLGLAPKRIIAHHNLIDGPGENLTHANVVAAAKFVDATAKDFRLAPGSPGLDAGALLAEVVGTDVAGKQRVHRAKVDIGAFRSGQ